MSATQTQMLDPHPTKIAETMKGKVYCCYRHFREGRPLNEQTHCYSHVKLGLILPKPEIGLAVKALAAQKLNERQAEKQQNQPEQLAVAGKGVKLKTYGYNLHLGDHSKKSLPHHLSTPFLYCDKVYSKGQRKPSESTLKHADGFLVTSTKTSCRKHLSRDLEFEEFLQKLSKAQRRQFFERTYNLTESMYQFYGIVEKCLKEQPNAQGLLTLFQKYCAEKKIDLKSRHEYMMVSRSQYEGFLKFIGFPQASFKLVSEFWELVFRQKIFTDYRVASSTAQVMSMKAFIYNFKKFFEDRNKYTFMFSKNMLSQRNHDLRHETLPWSLHFHQLELHLRDARPIQFSICQKLREQGYSQQADSMLQAIQERNLLALRLRTLASLLYPLLCQSNISFENLHQAFIARLQNQAYQMHEVEDFLNQFKLHRAKIHQDQPDFNQQILKASDLGDFIAYSRMHVETSKVVIEWLNEFYRYLYFNKDQDTIEYDVQTNLTRLTRDLTLSYDDITEFLHFRTARLQDENSILNQFLLEAEQFYTQEVLPRSMSNTLFISNMLSEWVLRKFKCSLLPFQKTFGVVKLMLPYLSGSLDPDLLSSVTSMLGLTQPTRDFTAKMLFTTNYASPVFRRCLACQKLGHTLGHLGHKNNQQQINNQQRMIKAAESKIDKYRKTINHKLKVTDAGIDNLEHVLLDWEDVRDCRHQLLYPNVRVQKTREIVIQRPPPVPKYPAQQIKKRFDINYVEVPKHVYKVTLAQQTSNGGTKPIGGSPVDNTKQETNSHHIRQQHVHEHGTICPICSIKVTMDCTAAGGSYCSCAVCLIKNKSFAKSECCTTTASDFQSTLRSVSDLQDQIFKLLTF